MHNFDFSIIVKFYEDYVIPRLPQIAKTILKKNNKAEGLIISNFKTVTQTVWYWHMNRHIDP